MGKTGPVPSGCGANLAILRFRPQRWARHSPRARPSLARFSLATPSTQVVLTGPSEELFNQLQEHYVQNSQD